jgi:hypothetical protein
MPGNGDNSSGPRPLTDELLLTEDRRTGESGLARSNPTGKLTLHRGGRWGVPNRCVTRALDMSEMLAETAPEETAEECRDIVAYLHGKPLSWEEIQRIAAEEDEAARSGTVRKAAAPRRRWRMRYRALAASVIAIATISYGVVGFRAHSRAVLARLQQDLETRSDRSVELTSNIPLRSQSDSDAIALFVVVSPKEFQPAVYHVEPAVIEGDVRSELRMHAFPDIGVSAGADGAVFLAGDVYSLDEVSKIKDIAWKVEGVHEVHFMHPQLRQASGPAFFGAIATNDPNIWGAKVTNVIVGSPAEKAGLHRGDIVREFNGETIPDGRTLEASVAHCAPGDRVEVRIHRDGEDEIVGARLSVRTLVAAN